MKLCAIAAACLLLATLAAAKPSVEVLMAMPSSQSPRITVLHEGNPLQNAKVEVVSADGKQRASLSTDEHGVVVLPPLAAGRYSIAATTAGRLQANLLLDISKHKSKKPSEFSLQLRVGPPTLEELIATAEENGRRERLHQFKGVAIDPSGAGIQQTKIDIFHQTSRGKVRVAAVESDATGHFSAHLADGAYTATFQAQGFAMQVYVFEINGDGDQKDLRIRLDLGAATESQATRISR